MSFNQRISPNLSETPSTRQVPACRQAGFTLIELMVVLAVLGVLLGIATGMWQSTRATRQVDAAVGKIRSAMVAARIQALTTGKTQYVGLDLANDKIASSVLYESNVYDNATSTWGASTVWDILDNVDIQESSVAGVPSTPQPTQVVFSFTARGTAASTGTTRSVLIASKDTRAAYKIVLTVNNVTGRVQAKQL